MARWRPEPGARRSVLQDRTIHDSRQEPDARQRYRHWTIQRATDLQRPSLRLAARGNAGCRNNVDRPRPGEFSAASALPGDTDAVSVMASLARSGLLGDLRVSHDRYNA